MAANKRRKRAAKSGGKEIKITRKNRVKTSKTRGKKRSKKTK